MQLTGNFLIELAPLNRIDYRNSCPAVVAAVVVAEGVLVKRWRLQQKRSVAAVVTMPGARTFFRGRL